MVQAPNYTTTTIDQKLNNFVKLWCMARALSRLLSNPIFTQNPTFFLYRANTMHQTTPNAGIEDFWLFSHSLAPNYTIGIGRDPPQSFDPWQAASGRGSVAPVAGRQALASLIASPWQARRPGAQALAWHRYALAALQPRGDVIVVAEDARHDRAHWQGRGVIAEGGGAS